MYPHQALFIFFINCFKQKKSMFFREKLYICCEIFTRKYCSPVLLYNQSVVLESLGQDVLFRLCKWIAKYFWTNNKKMTLQFTILNRRFTKKSFDLFKNSCSFQFSCKNREKVIPDLLHWKNGQKKKWILVSQVKKNIKSPEFFCLYAWGW